MSQLGRSSTRKFPKVHSFWLWCAWMMFSPSAVFGNGETQTVLSRRLVSRIIWGHFTVLSNDAHNRSTLSHEWHYIAWYVSLNLWGTGRYPQQHNTSFHRPLICRANTSIFFGNVGYSLVFSTLWTSSDMLRHVWRISRPKEMDFSRCAYGILWNLWRRRFDAPSRCGSGQHRGDEFHEGQVGQDPSRSKQSVVLANRPKKT